MKRTLLLTVSLLFSLLLTAAEVPQIGNIPGRRTVSLNGAWNYIVDVLEHPRSPAVLL